MVLVLVAHWSFTRGFISANKRMRNNDLFMKNNNEIVIEYWFTHLLSHYLLTHSLIYLLSARGASGCFAQHIMPKKYYPHLKRMT